VSFVGVNSGMTSVGGQERRLFETKKVNATLSASRVEVERLRRPDVDADAHAQAADRPRTVPR
jgi:hypothetical protein